ncbi:hypothetical protein I79_001026 [Cricetulus griseus]|uniref:Uncharacterized protein n=1 Tax=Cricetulus griseus TaxID=10029 RepID=G3GTN9_CRIGR|nr:hypothetical protein I79_001026 [Cricetulus griseus]
MGSSSEEHREETRFVSSVNTGVQTHEKHFSMKQVLPSEKLNLDNLKLQGLFFKSNQLTSKVSSV